MLNEKIMKNLAQQVTSIKHLCVNHRYFSRSMGVDFIVLNIDIIDRKLKLGIKDKVREVNFLKFNKVYFKEGIININ